MAEKLLSDVACKNATNVNDKGIALAVRKLSDGGGLYLWVYAGDRKYWRLRYWIDGKEKSISLGVYPSVSLADARQLMAEANKHKDPSENRKAEKRQQKISAANSFEAVATEWFNKRVHTWVAHHTKDVKRRLENNIYPHIGNRPIADIEPHELLDAVRKIEQRGAHDLAHRVLSVCGQVFRYGVATSRCKSDPTRDLRGALTPHKQKNQNAVKPEQLPELLRAIAGYDQMGDMQTRLGLQLLAHTFVRTSELINAEWSEFDLDNALWIIPASRMKMKTEHLVPLTKQVLAMLEQVKAIGGDSRYLFPGRNPDKPMSNNTMLFALYRLGYKGKMTGHGFRAVASTSLNECGKFNHDVIERQLAHCERNEVRGAYNHADYLPERSRMMLYWSDYLDSLQAGAKVLRFKQA